MGAQVCSDPRATAFVLPSFACSTMAVEEKAAVAMDGLSDADAAEIFARFGYKMESIQRLYGGYASSNFRVVGRKEGDDSGEAKVLLLKVNYYGSTREDAEHQLFVMDFLRGSRFPTNYPHAAVDGGQLVEHGGRRAMLLDFVPDAVAGDKVMAADASKVPKILSNLAEALATLHGVEWPKDKALRDIRVGYPVCNMGDLLHGDDVEKLKAEPRFTDHPFVAYLDSCLVWLRDLFARDLLWGLIHGDAFLDNTLFKDGPAGSGQCQLLALVDWEDSCVGPFALDVAVCASACCFTAANELIAERLETILRAYLAKRPLSAAERGSFADFMLAGSLACGFYRFCEFNWRKPDSDEQAKKSYELHAERAKLLAEGSPARSAVETVLGRIV